MNMIMPVCRSWLSAAAEVLFALEEVSFAHDHECGFAFEVHIRLAADVDGYPVDAAAGEGVGGLAGVVVGDGLAVVPAYVQARAGDGEGAERLGAGRVADSGFTRVECS